MLRYWAGGLAAIAIILTAAFFVLASFNNHRAEAGPPPAISVTFEGDGVTPERLSLEHNRLYQLTFANHGSLRRRLSLDSVDVESQPVETRLFDARAAAASAPGIDMTAAAGQDVPQLVRFTEHGTYDLRIEVPGREDPVLTVTVEVR